MYVYYEEKKDDFFCRECSLINTLNPVFLFIYL